MEIKEIKLLESQQKSLKPKLPRWMQIIFGIIVFGFLMRSLIDGWQQVRDFEWHFQPIILGVVLVIIILYTIFQGVVWTWMVRRLNMPVSYPSGVRAFIITQLAKYIPGGVWSFAALSATGHELGLPGSLLNLILLLNLLFASWVSALLALPIIPIAFSHLTISINYIALSLLIISAAIAPWVLRWAIRFIVRWRHLPDTIATEQLTHVKTMIFLLIVFSLLHLLPATSFYLYISSLTHIDPSEAVFAVMAWSGAWFIGFIILIAPSGLGVREATLTVLLQFILPAPIAAALALGFRLITTLADLLLMLGMLVISGRFQRKKHVQSLEITL